MATRFGGRCAELRATRRCNTDEAAIRRAAGLPLGRPLSQAELAARAGVTQGAISAIEIGTSLPTDSTFAAISRALGLSEAERVAWWLLRLEPLTAPVGR